VLSILRSKIEGRSSIYNIWNNGANRFPLLKPNPSPYISIHTKELFVNTTSNLPIKGKILLYGNDYSIKKVYFVAS